MDVKWLVENEVFNEDLGPLIDEIKRQGHALSVVKYIPFQGGEFNPFADDDCVVCYGSLNLIQQIQRTKKWIPGPWCNLNNFKCVNYFSKLGPYLLNRNYAMVPIVELLRNKDFYFDHFSTDQGGIFVRPDSGFKEFTGRLIGYDELTREALGFGYYHEDESLLVVVAKPQPIEQEWRFVIGQKKVITGSEYRAEGRYGLKVACDPKAEAFAAEIAANPWEPDPMYVVDICKCNGEYKLLEINSFSCSGQYSCDPKPIVETASRLAVEEYLSINS